MLSHGEFTIKAAKSSVRRAESRVSLLCWGNIITRSSTQREHLVLPSVFMSFACRPICCWMWKLDKSYEHVKKVTTIRAPLSFSFSVFINYVHCSIHSAKEMITILRTRSQPFTSVEARDLLG